MTTEQALTETEVLVADAASSSASTAAEAVQRAVEMNDDPDVADVLEEAAVETQTTVGRLEWLKRRLRGRWRHTADPGALT
jgi:hypothetical protein